MPLTVTPGNLPEQQVKIGECVEISGTPTGGARILNSFGNGFISWGELDCRATVFWFSVYFGVKKDNGDSWVDVVNVLTGIQGKKPDKVIIVRLHMRSSHACKLCPNQNLKIL